MNFIIHIILVLSIVDLAIERERYVGVEGGQVEVCMIVVRGRIVVGVRVYLHIETICKLTVLLATVRGGATRIPNNGQMCTNQLHSNSSNLSL